MSTLRNALERLMSVNPIVLFALGLVLLALAVGTTAVISPATFNQVVAPVLTVVETLIGFLAGLL
jgi:uncharacterized membrane protein